MLSVYLLFFIEFIVSSQHRECVQIYTVHSHSHLVECVSWAVTAPASLMRSRSSEVGGGAGHREGSRRVNYQR